MFKPIKNFEHYGEINEIGIVRSFRHKKFRSPFLDNSGQWCLTINRKRHRLKTLVVSTFDRPYNNETEEVIYLDGDKNNLHISNLKITKSKTRFKISQEVADLIRKYHKSGYRNSDLARKFQLSKTAISLIVKGKIWNSSNSLTI